MPRFKQVETGLIHATFIKTVEAKDLEHAEALFEIGEGDDLVVEYGGFAGDVTTEVVELDNQ